MTQQAPTDEEIRAVAKRMRMQPWGIGSRQEDAIAYGRALLAQYGSPARCGVPDGWRIELLDHGMWCISSPSGDGVHIQLNDPRPISEMFRQLCQSLTAPQEGK